MEFQSDFGRLALAIDQAEALAGERRDGSTEAMGNKILHLESRLYASRPERRDDWRWLARRLARAHENDWCAEAVAPLVKLAGGEVGGAKAIDRGRYPM